jgi:NAD(P)-dependent dehydrogenase (short-subunit alcohol dehydrogenase family)
MSIVITGANRGIGRALFDRYTDMGQPVIGTHRAPASPGWLSLDVTKPQDHKAVAAALAATPVSLLVCNAGVYLDKGERPEDGYPPALWDATFAANVTGVFLTIQALLPQLRRAQDSKIAIISSQMASQTRAPGGSYIYRASKAAVLNLGRNLAADLRHEGIAVGIYHPGWVRSDMGGSAADISVDAAARGLIDRFAALTVETTGVFETWDGRPHPF